MPFQTRPGSGDLLTKTGMITLVVVVYLGVRVLTAGEVAAQTAGSHEHGQARLNVVLADEIVQLEFISPAINLLGFESRPATPEQRARLMAVGDLLESGQWLIGGALADCAIQGKTLELPEFDSHEEGDPHEDPGHFDYRLEYLYECPRAPEAALRIRAFKHFPGIDRITVQWLTTQGQGLSELTPANTILRMN